jgi:hypothetical protein
MLLPAPLGSDNWLVSGGGSSPVVAATTASDDNTAIGDDSDDSLCQIFWICGRRQLLKRWCPAPSRSLVQLFPRTPRQNFYGLAEKVGGADEPCQTAPLYLIMPLQDGIGDTAQLGQFFPHLHDRGRAGDLDRVDRRCDICGELVEVVWRRTGTRQDLGERGSVGVSERTQLNVPVCAAAAVG